ncbi:unnamed protein product [Prorocentrum cordatum]|uniref:Phospholipase B-like n=1 Tax=Prorocentrum cordatum TaxID=2364126 RepID=A0ABN9U1A8_9DINO|nr:unnamed protein product [Polarella glacialis]
MAKFLLLSLSAPLAQGIGLRPDLKPQAARSGPQSAQSTDAASTTRTMSAQALQYFRGIENASAKSPLLLMTLKSNEVVSIGGDFRPSEEFESTGQEQRQQQGQASALPWGIGSPQAGSNAPVFQYSGMPTLDFPKSGIEYSLEAGGNLQSFSSARQDVKIITQVLENVTNGFFLDTNGGDGERPSNTLLLELTGWRGLITEPMMYTYAELWGKMRKSWIFLGCMSPHENATKIGFDWYGKIDENSGHRIHAYPINSFLAEMGGLTTVDFWNLNTGNYEAEVLNETLLYSGSNIEFGVVLISYDGRTAGLGDSRWVQSRSKSETTDLIWSIFQSAGFNYIGGLDAYLTTDTTPSYDYHDHVFVNPAYFTARNIPVPGSIKAAPPPRMAVSSNARNFQGFWDTWDEGLTPDQEVDKMVQYISNAKAAAAATESTPFAHRVDPSHTPAADASGYNPIPSYNPTRPPPMRVA